MNILVPTDFSKYADQAFHAACLFAEKFDATLHLYHSANIPDDWEDLSAELKYKDKPNKMIAQAAKDKMLVMVSKAEKMGLHVVMHYTGGKFLKNIEEILMKVDFELIVMGSHGVSGKEEWFLGSNTQKVLRKVHAKVLVIKNPIQELNFKRVLFASNLHVEDQESFRQFLKFIKPFSVDEIHVMAVDTSGYFSQPTFVMKEALKDFKKISNTAKCETHFYPDYSVESGIRHFSQERKMDLIAVSNHHKRNLKRILFGSNVEMLVNHSTVPVLSIDY